jgi:O-antigen ligase
LDLAHKLLALLAALLLALGAFFAYNWIRAHDDYVRATAQVKADQSTNRPRRTVMPASMAKVVARFLRGVPRSRLARCASRCRVPFA